MNTAGIQYNSNNKNYFILSKKKFMAKSILLSLLIHWIYVVQGKQLVSFFCLKEQLVSFIAQCNVCDNLEDQEKGSLNF